MPQALRKAAPFLVLAGIALMPRDRSRPRAPAHSAPPPNGAREGPRDEPNPNRSTGDPAQVHDTSRGRGADSPRDIPAKGWKDILIRTWKEFGDDQAPLVAAGITFYTLLALFPAMGAFAALYGLFADVAEAQRHLALLQVVLPPDTLRLVGEQLVRLSAGHEGGLSLAFVGGLLLSIWSANGATKAMITAMNIAYDETEKRSFVRKTATSLAFTLGLLLFGLATVAVLAIPAAIEPFAGVQAATLFRWVTYPALLVALGFGLALLYRFGPSRDRVRWRWITWGSATALLLWVAASAAFSIYVANFADYEKTYGSLGAVIGFLMWLYFSAQVVLLGAELNSEIEHQTVKDTTVGPERPLGVRGAVMADTVGAPQ